jgi:hypothetical protein
LSKAVCVLVPTISSRGKGIFWDCLEAKNGLLGLLTFPDRLLGKAISYHPMFRGFYLADIA